MKPIPLKPLLLILALATLVGGSIAAYHLRQPPTATTPTDEIALEFDATQAPSWWAGNPTTPQASDAGQSPTLRRAIAQGTKEAPAGDCFVTYSYWADTDKDPDEALREMTASSDTSTTGDFVLEPFSVVDLTLQLPDGETPFQLHHYRKVGSDSTSMSAGEAYAAVRAETGYVEIRGVCKTVEQFAAMRPVFSAMSIVKK